MSVYEFQCDPCRVIFEREYPMAKAANRSKCPECKKLSDRHWDPDRLPQVKVSGTKHKVKVTNSDVRNVYERSIEHSREYLATQESPYADYTKDLGEMVKDGEATKRPSNKQHEAEKRYKRITLDSHKRAGLDPLTKPRLDV